ncbi:MAG TPA: tRNA (adenosine(37)-N6)-threonylcarbamoyltransferase complex dimerization subunit type 1 TsaB [Ignavibacteriaceae bacterium]|nr:tRNA (adenosine(37)-N6)-threonylcarbamoyltransferase complex dimerization subunit type 1 TsaB [Ignavibacteriaceae bacterium]
MNDIFPILAIETSDSICGVCVYFNEEKYYSSKLVLKHSYAEKLFELINSVLKSASITQSDLKSIAVSSGPGSFTGLRIGMSAAKGIAQALSIPIISVPTFEAFAYQISKILPEKSLFILANKVGRDELYFAKFQIMGNNYIFKSELKIVPLLELDSLVEDIPVFGNVLKSHTGKNIEIKNLSSPDPEFIAKWAANFGFEKLITDFDLLEPNYMKEFIVKEKKHV